MEGSRKRRHGVRESKGLRADVRTAWRRMLERTSAGHMRWLGILLLCGVGLRVACLFEPVTYGESATVIRITDKSVGHILSDHTLPENHFLHTVLVKMSVAMFGTHRWSARLPALLSGILLLPLFYAFVRVMFNRHIALLCLALLAGSGPLVQYSALCTGYSLTWLFMALALLAGRHFAKQNNWSSIGVVTLLNVLALWVSPQAIHIVVMVYVWLYLYLVTNYESTVGQRSLRVVLSMLACVLLTTAIYFPIAAHHSIAHLFHHPSLGDNNWEIFSSTQADGLFAMWDYITGHTSVWLAIPGLIGLVYSAYVSVKFRIMVVALMVGAIPLTVLLTAVAPPEAWNFTVPFLHLSSAIAVFYLLKFIQEKLVPNLDKGTRTAVAAAILLGVFGFFAIYTRDAHLRRFGEAGDAAAWLRGLVKSTDRVLAEHPVDAPLAFEMACAGLDPALVGADPRPGGRAFLAVAPAQGQTIFTVAAVNQETDLIPRLVKKQDWKMLELWAEPDRSPIGGPMP